MSVHKYKVQIPVLVRYTPQKVDLETKFRPFIPDYIPAVGDIDAFIKVSTEIYFFRISFKFLQF